MAFTRISFETIMTIAEAESRVLGSTGDQDITGDELASTCQIIVCLELAQIAPADSGRGGAAL